MFPFSHSVTPAVRSHLEAQFAFFNDVSTSLSRAFQNLCDLNMKLGQTLLEEGNIASQQLLTIENPADAMAVTSARAQPAADKLRAYQQHLSRVVADGQIELARVTEQHSHVTSRTARGLADKVAQAASEENEKSSSKQQEIMQSFRDPFQHPETGRGNGSAAVHGSMQSAGQNMNGKVDDDIQRAGASFQGGEQAVQSRGKSGAKAD